MSFDTSLLDKAQAKHRAKWEQERQRLLNRMALEIEAVRPLLIRDVNLFLGLLTQTAPDDEGM